MKRLRALYFPETSITARQVSQELVFFDKFFCYQPTEEPPDAPSDDIEDLCQGYAPAPFAEDLPRFKQLIRDLKGNEEEFYSGQISSLSLDYLENRNEKTVRELIGAISGKPGRQSPESEKVILSQSLWKARLLLKLAEILAHEERELQEQLQAVKEREKILFNVLKGETEISSPPVLQLHFDNRLPIRPEILLKAWGALFLADEKREDLILSCGQEDAAETLFDVNESMTDQRPLRLFRIPLPHTHGMEIDGYLARRSTFRSQAGDLLSDFARQLKTTADKGQEGDTLKNFTHLAAEWTRHFEKSGTWGEPQPLPPGSQACPPQPHLEVYLLNVSLVELFAHYRREKEPPAGPAGSAFGLVAFKSVRSSTCTG